MSKYGISKMDLEKIFERDKLCSYCKKEMIYPFDKNNRNDSTTIEHLNYDGPFYIKTGLNIVDIVIVCGSCNSSRGVKKLIDWLKTDYCINKNINSDTVSSQVRDYLIRNPLK